MEVCIAFMRGAPVMLELKNGLVHINGEIQAIKGLMEEEVRAFSEAVAAIPYTPGPGYEALVNARRAAFLAALLSRAVGDDCVNRITHILDSVHYDVLEYLGDTDE